MAFEALLAFIGATLCGGLAIFVLLANSRLFIHRVFASGMSALAMVQICAGMGAQAVLPADIVGWEYLRLLSAACMPGIWLLFSVGYALKAGQLTYDCRYSTMHGIPVTDGRGFRGLKPLWYNGVPP